MSDTVGDIGALAAAARQDLLVLRSPDGGWPYQSGASSSTEPTALAVLGLMATGTPGGELTAAADWLAARQRSDGLFNASATHQDANWATPLAAIALGRLGNGAAQDAAVNGLLGEQVFVFDGRLQPGIYGFDTTLRGWPWRGDDFSFVEPTSLAMILLKRAGRSGEARVREAVRMLHARALAAGGWNYGEPEVLGDTMFPTIVPTALALLALANEQDDTTNAGRDWLLSERGQIGTLFSLGWACIALNVLGLLDDTWRADLLSVWNASTPQRRGPLEMSLTLLALAPREGHPLGVA